MLLYHSRRLKNLLISSRRARPVGPRTTVDILRGGAIMFLRTGGGCAWYFTWRNTCSRAAFRIIMRVDLAPMLVSLLITHDRVRNFCMNSTEELTREWT